ncbi:hypothetical protein [Pseudotabrizicola sp. L79]|uniref:hypothetical protein n=1 Tax=Pseudotabrizicola sp. L79 TaxID=3118402 RepID=UPI002F91FB6E
MNMHVSNVGTERRQDADLIDVMAPPLAPLAMPKQVLTVQAGPVRLALGAVFALMALLRPGQRRAG